MNCLEIELEPNEEAYVYYKVDWDKRALGKRLGKLFKNVEPLLSNLTSDTIKQYILNGTIQVGGVDILANELIPSRHFHQAILDQKVWKNGNSGEFAVMLDSTMTKEIEYGYYSREFLNKIQNLRKESNLELTKEVEIFFQADSDELREAIVSNLGSLREKLKKRFISGAHKPVAYPVIASSAFKI